MASLAKHALLHYFNTVMRFFSLLLAHDPFFNAEWNEEIPNYVFLPFMHAKIIMKIDQVVIHVKKLAYMKQPFFTGFHDVPHV